MIESTRWRVLDTLNSRYLYGQVPLLHAMIFTIEIIIMLRLVTKFNSYYEEKPILTIMVTNSILNGISDTVAQSLTAILAKRRRNMQIGKDISDGIEMPSYEEKSAYVSEFMIPHRYSSPPSFDFERLTRFMSYGFIISPLQFEWLQFLAKAFPMTKESATLPALYRVGLDQLIFAPLSIACFFTFMTIAEGGGRRAISRKFQDVFFPALKASFMVWPLVQILNFRVIPLPFQIPFMSTVGIVWIAYLSLTNSAEEPPL